MNVHKKIKEIINYGLAITGKRLTNLNAPAKPYQQGIQFLKQIIDRPALIIDIGVADGTPDLTSSFPIHEYRYMLIDANPKFATYLDGVRDLYPDTIIEKCFCGEKEQSIPFFINKTGHTSSRYYTVGNNETIEVKVERLDVLIEKHRLRGPFFLKIDVEGAELDVLRGAVNILNMCDIVILETWINVPGSGKASDFASLVSFMSGHGFIVFDFFGGHNHKNGVLAHIDTVFVKENSKYRNASF